MKNRFLTVFVIIIFMFASFGCSKSKPSWFTPHAALVDVKEQWQIQGYHLSVDSPEQFTFDIGLAEKSSDYSFWLNQLSWHDPKFVFDALRFMLYFIHTPTPG